MKIKRIEPFGSLVHFTKDCSTFRLTKDETREYLNFDRDEFPDELSAPEIVHLELTSRCNKNCEYCYVEEKEELTTEQWKEAIDDIRSNGVFQFTFGGGEPFLREDLFELAQWVRKIKQRNLAITTNGTLIEDDKRLEYFDQINFSYHGSTEAIEEPIKIAKKYSKVGVNFILRKDTIMALPKVAQLAKKHDTELLIMSYKPVNNDWEQVLSPITVKSIAEKVSNYGVRVAVDMMTCNRCTGSEAFVTIDSDGSVYPCSFVRRSMGNILNNDFKQIWKQRDKPNCPYLTNKNVGSAYE